MLIAPFKLLCIPLIAPLVSRTMCSLTRSLCFPSPGFPEVLIQTVFSILVLVLSLADISKTRSKKSAMAYLLSCLSCFRFRKYVTMVVLRALSPSASLSLSILSRTNDSKKKLPDQTNTVFVCFFLSITFQFIILINLSLISLKWNLWNFSYTLYIYTDSVCSLCSLIYYLFLKQWMESITRLSFITILLLYTASISTQQ